MKEIIEAIDFDVLKDKKKLKAIEKALENLK